MEMKYVMLGGVQPVIFSPGIPHDRFKDLGTITSAGFVRFSVAVVSGFPESVSDFKIKVETFGESVTAADDEKLIERYMNGK